MTDQNDILVQTKDLEKVFVSGGGLFSGSKRAVHAVNRVNLCIYRGETLGLVGESGCGKSTLGRVLLQLLPATSGQVLFEGQDLSQLDKKALREKRREFQMIFQDPYSCLNPRMTVLELVREPLDIYNLGTPAEREEAAAALLETVGLSEQNFTRYPHEFSGGQRQRIDIARALIFRPKFVVCDEPVSALDASVRASVLNLMRRLQQEMSLTYLFVSHDLSVIKHISDRIAVMYLGSIVEIADRDELYADPLHPYTQALIDAIPIPDPEKKAAHKLIEGDIPSPYNPPQGCLFHTRCPKYVPGRCDKIAQELKEVKPGHFVACECLYG